jgi:hypothetical protein
MPVYKAVTVCSNPLLHDELAKSTLDFVGPGEALYVRSVNSSWKACYDKLMTAR